MKPDTDTSCSVSKLCANGRLRGCESTHDVRALVQGPGRLRNTSRLDEVRELRGSRKTGVFLIVSFNVP